MNRIMLPILVGVVVVGVLGGPAEGIAIDDFSSATNDRFANNENFVMDGYDLSGVGRSSDGRWATLVSRNVFVSANHFHPSTSNVTVTFYQTNDPNGQSVTRDVSSGQRVGTSDIWMGVLKSPVPVGYAAYDFATDDLTDFQSSVYSDVNAFLFGKSGTFTDQRNIAVGRNKLDGGGIYNVEGTTGVAITATDDGEANAVPYEAMLENGDSGGPLFVDIQQDGNLTLVGSNWFTDDTLNGFAYYGNDNVEMQEVINSNPIPEPTAIALLVVGVLSLLRRRSD